MPTIQASALTVQSADSTFTGEALRRVLSAAMGVFLMIGASGCMGFGEEAPEEVVVTTGAPTRLTYPKSQVYLFVDEEMEEMKLTSQGAAITSLAISPTLPAGLEFDATDGTISGTPTEVTDFKTYTIKAKNAHGVGVFQLGLAVTPNSPVLDYSGTKTLTFTVGTGISTITPTNSGGDIDYCISDPALPDGLSLSTQCELTGTPTTPVAAADYTIRAYNSGGNSPLFFNFTIKDRVPDFSYAGSPKTLTRGVAMSAWTATNVGGTIVSCSSSPSLPAGLSLSSTCEITGTPTTVQGATAYTITATNSGGTDTAAISLTIQDVLPAISYAGSPLTYTKGVSISPLTPTNTGGGPTSCAPAPALPSGLTLSSSCVVTGTPTAVTAAANYVITATNSAGSAAAPAINITIKDKPPVISYSGSPYTFTVATAITAKTPTNSGGAIVSCAISPALPAGLSLAAGTCVISGTPTTASAESTYTVTATNTGGDGTATIKIKVNEAPPNLTFADSPFTFTKNTMITPASPTNTGGTVTGCSASPSLPPGLSVSSTCVISGTPTTVLPAADYVITGTNSAGSSNATVNITVNEMAPEISYAASPYTYVKDTVITTLPVTNTGGTITSCAIDTPLPAGLNFNTTNCTISGTPTAVASVATYTVTATNAGGNDSTTIDITVNDRAPSISYAATTHNFTLNEAITALTAANAGGTITSCTPSPALPAGLSLDNTTCEITGTPTAITAAAVYVITASNSGGNSAVSLTIAVKDAAPSISYATATHVFTKDTVIANVLVTNSGGTVVSCASSPTLPAGLSLSATCDLSGTPTAVAAAATYTITATNTGGTSTATLNLTVNDVLPEISYASATFSWEHQSAIATQTPTNTGGTIVSCAATPTLPAGLTLSSTCVITGTPTAITAAADYTITATNSAGSDSTSLNITIPAILPAITYAGGPKIYEVGSAIAAWTPTNTGGTVTSCSSSPALPDGLSLSSTCVISGTPTTPAVLTVYTLSATNSGGTDTEDVTITVNAEIPDISFTGSPFVLTKGVAMTTATPVNNGGTIVTCDDDDPLPAGLSLSATCVLSGTPTAVTALATYDITAHNSGGDDTTTITITVNDAAPVISYSSAPFTYTKDVAITNATVTNTGGAIVTCVDTTPLPAGLSISNACVISGTPTAITASASYTITATNTGGSHAIAITIAVNDAAPSINYIPTSYSFTYTKDEAIAALTPNSTAGAIVSCAISPSLPAGLSLNTGTCSITGTPTAISAATSYTVTATNSGGSASQVITIAVNDEAPAISYAGSPLSYENGSAIATLTPVNTGGTITSCSSAPALPGGLSLSSACVITGTPNAVTAAADYTITATNTGGSNSTSINIAVNAVAPNFSYAGSPFTYTLRSEISTLTPTNTGGTITSCSASPTLPAGLSLSSTCVITGTPTETSASTAYTITATNSGGNDTANISIQVKNVAQILFHSSTALSGAVNGTPSGSKNIWKVSVDGTDRAKLTLNNAAGLDSILASWMDGGTKVAYLSKRALDGTTNGTTAGAYNVWTANASGSGANARTANGAATLNSDQSVRFSPDGTKIVFASKTALTGLANGTPTDSYNIWIMNADGTGKTALTGNSDANLDSINPVFSDDGLQVYFQSKADQSGLPDGTPNNCYNIWKINVNGTGLTALTTENTVGKDSVEPALSSDSSLVLYSSLADVAAVPSSSYNIWRMNNDGSVKAALTTNTAAGLDSMQPQFSSDDGEIAFVSKMNVNASTAQSYNVWTMTSAGGSQTALTTNNGPSMDSQYPSYSPDDQKIVFQSLQDVGGVASLSYNIWVINSSGSGSATALTTNTNANLHSSLAPGNVWYAE